MSHTSRERKNGSGGKDVVKTARSGGKFGGEKSNGYSEEREPKRPEETGR